jgi:hypothetical protein
VIICLLLHIVQGRQNMVKKMTQNHRITVQTPPFCCVFPCLPKLPMEAYVKGRTATIKEA